MTSGKSLPDIWLLGRRQPAYRGHESDTGFQTELQEPVAPMQKREAQVVAATRRE